MTSLPQVAIDRLSKLIPRLASDHDGEIIATVRAIRRTLASSGACLHDVVETLNKPAVTVERIVYRDRPAPAPIPKPESPPILAADVIPSSCASHPCADVASSDLD